MFVQAGSLVQRFGIALVSAVLIVVFACARAAPSSEQTFYGRWSAQEGVVTLNLDGDKLQSRNKVQVVGLLSTVSTELRALSPWHVRLRMLRNGRTSGP
jgi:hypothetical protein